MIPRYTNLRSISKLDLQGLVDGQAEESVHLDFKVDSYDADSEEWCKDISAFANTAGGVIAMGIREDGGIAKELVGVPGKSIDAKIRALTQKYCSSVKPVPAVEFWPIDIGGDRVILLAGTPPSRFQPHACRQSTRFYKRMHRNVQEMDRDDLNRAFLASISQEDAARAIHKKRSLAFRLSPLDAVTMVLDAFPAPCDQERFDPSSDSHMVPVRELLSNTSWAMATSRIVFDGLQFVRESSSQLLIQRSGAVLASWPWEPDRQGNQPSIEGVQLCEHLITASIEAVKVVRSFDASSPVHLCLSLFGCQGISIGVYGPWLKPQPIAEDALVLPILFWEGAVPNDDETMRLLRPWFNRIWNACGLRQCDLYHKETGTPDWATFSRRR